MKKSQVWNKTPDLMWMTLCVRVHHKTPGRLKPGEHLSCGKVKQCRSTDKLAALPKLLTNKQGIRMNILLRKK